VAAVAPTGDGPSALDRDICERARSCTDRDEWTTATPEVSVSNRADFSDIPPVGLTAAEREWIRRQGLTARVLAGEQRRVADRLSDSRIDVARVQEQMRRDRGRFDRRAGR